MSLQAARETVTQEGLLQWPAIFFGWPAALLSIVLSTVGILRSKPRLLVAGAVTLTPFALYLSAHPTTFWAFVLPLLPLLSAFAVARGHRRLSWIPLSLAVAILVWLAVVVIGSYREARGGGEPVEKVSPSPPQYGEGGQPPAQKQLL